MCGGGGGGHVFSSLSIFMAFVNIMTGSWIVGYDRL